jgi:hypothetical protein
MLILAKLEPSAYSITFVRGHAGSDPTPTAPTWHWLAGCNDVGGWGD